MNYKSYKRNRRENGIDLGIASQVRIYDYWIHDSSGSSFSSSSSLFVVVVACQSRFFLDASSHLYKRVCLSVRPSVCTSVRYPFPTSGPPAAASSLIHVTVSVGGPFYNFLILYCSFPIAMLS